MKRLFLILSVALLLITTVTISAQETAEASPVVFQTNTPADQPTEAPQSTEVVVIPTVEVTPVETPVPTPSPADEIAVYTSMNLAAVALIALAVALIAGLGIMAYIISKMAFYIAHSQPAFAAPIYATGNAGYKAADDVIGQIESKLATNDITWDDAIVNSVRKIGRENWKKFVADAKAAGVQLPDVPLE